jgi:hypothetical protein
MKIKYMLRPEALVGLAIDSLAVTGGRLHAGQVQARPPATAPIRRE